MILLKNVDTVRKRMQIGVSFNVSMDTVKQGMLVPLEMTQTPACRNRYGLQPSLSIAFP